MWGEYQVDKSYLQLCTTNVAFIVLLINLISYLIILFSLVNKGNEK